MKTGKNELGTEKIRWDLSIFYKGIDDPQIDADIKQFVTLTKNFNETHKGRLAETLGQSITDYLDIKMLESKIIGYLFLTQSTNVSDPVIKAKIAETDRTLASASADYLTFFEIELVSLSEEVLRKLYENNTVVAFHKPWIEKARRSKEHLLSEPVESALVKRSPFGPDSWGEFFRELESDLSFEFQGEKKNLEEMLDLLSQSKDPDERFQVMTIINNGLAGTFAKYSAQALYMTTGSENVEDKERKYKHPMEARNVENQIPDPVVNALHKTVADIAGPLARDFYRLKAKHLGLEKLRWSDRNALMPFSDSTQIPFDEAMKTVLGAYQSFSPTLAELIEQQVRKGCIDAPANKGREGGAYNCSLVLPSLVPVSFTFLNYLGSNRDVMTLAHELGHSVHGLLAGKTQGPLMSDAPMAYCETASVFGEMTTSSALKKKLIESGDIESLLALVMSKIDDTINTAVRQIAFSNFERRIHGMDASYSTWSTPKKYSPEELSAIWLEVNKELYGEDGDVFTYENMGNLWAYVGHFHSPFYVYSYAFGELLTQSLYAKRDQIGENFEPLYLDLLRSGGTKNVVELLAPFGLDPTSENFWADGINVGLGAMVREAIELSKQMGIEID